MKKPEPHISKIIWRDAKSTLSPAEYMLWKAKYDKFWAKLIADAKQRIAEDEKKGIKFKRTPKSEMVAHSLEIAAQLDIKLPGCFKRLYYDDVYSIECKLEHELMLKNHEKEGCEVIFIPPRAPTSEIISRMIERAKDHKAKGLKSFWDWPKQPRG